MASPAFNELVGLLKDPDVRIREAAAAAINKVILRGLFAQEDVFKEAAVLDKEAMKEAERLLNSVDMSDLSPCAQAVVKQEAYFAAKNEKDKAYFYQQIADIRAEESEAKEKYNGVMVGEELHTKINAEDPQLISKLCAMIYFSVVPRNTKEGKLLSRAALHTSPRDRNPFIELTAPPSYSARVQQRFIQNFPRAASIDLTAGQPDIKLEKHVSVSGDLGPGEHMRVVKSPYGGKRTEIRNALADLSRPQEEIEFIENWQTSAGNSLPRPVTGDLQRDKMTDILRQAAAAEMARVMDSRFRGNDIVIGIPMENAVSEVVDAIKSKLAARGRTDILVIPIDREGMEAAMNRYGARRGIILDVDKIQDIDKLLRAVMDEMSLLPRIASLDLEHMLAGGREACEKKYPSSHGQGKPKPRLANVDMIFDKRRNSWETLESF
jgi:hypothetical protein